MNTFYRFIFIAWFTGLLLPFYPANGGVQQQHPPKQTPKADELLSLILQSSSEETSAQTASASSIYRDTKQFFDWLKKKRFSGKQSLSSLRKIYRRTGNAFFGTYALSSSMPQTLSGERYNCVSSCLLYAFLFEELGYNYRIFLTHTHTYLSVRLKEKEILLETTDPIHGLITNTKAIEKQLLAYRLESLTRMDSSATSQLPIEEINLQELAGVYFYNRFLVHYRQGNFFRAARAFNQAALLYKNYHGISQFVRVFASI